jgi:hypothetical protein
LFEVKTARPTIHFRAGSCDGFDDAREKIGKARDQIVETARLIAEGHERFAHIPGDRPAVGLIVTMEPFYTRQLFLDEGLPEAPAVPLDAIPAYALEQLVAQLSDRADAGQRLLAALAHSDAKIPDAMQATRGLPLVDNVIIEQAWDQWSSWPGFADAEDPETNTGP